MNVKSTSGTDFNPQNTQNLHLNVIAGVDYQIQEFFNAFFFPLSVHKSSPQEVPKSSQVLTTIEKPTIEILFFFT
jgi:hypothetical protein